MTSQRPASLIAGANAALLSCDLEEKVAITRLTAELWRERKLALEDGKKLAPARRPGRPEKPELLPPAQVPKRPLKSRRGRIALIHAIAHIELNAIDLALDIIVRFGRERMPRSFFDGWMKVADEEAKHFSLLRERLKIEGHDYGDFPAHDGLWEAAGETGHDLTARLAIVPLVLEARGLDVTPPLVKKLRDFGDHKTADIFEIIYEDEKGHVAIGAKWYRYLCQKQGIDPASSFASLVSKYFRGSLKPPFNDRARAANGLTPLFYRSLSPLGN